MSKLTGSEIVAEVAQGRIVIAPFDPKRVNPNSYNLALGPTLLVYTSFPLDPYTDNPTREIVIPATGYVLEPGVLYLGSTAEYTETHAHVPQIDGRSSSGRLGISVHVTAGFGDVGFRGAWVLELTVVHPVRVHVGQEICQISYTEVTGPITPYRGRYQNQSGPVASRQWLGDQKTSLPGSAG